MLVLDLKDGKLQDLRKEEEGKMLHKLQAIRMSEDFWDRVHRFCSEGCMWVKPLVS